MWQLIKLKTISKDQSKSLNKTIKKDIYCKRIVNNERLAKVLDSSTFRFFFQQRNASSERSVALAASIGWVINIFFKLFSIIFIYRTGEGETE